MHTTQALRTQYAPSFIWLGLSSRQECIILSLILNSSNQHSTQTASAPQTASWVHRICDYWGGARARERERGGKEREGQGKREGEIGEKRGKERRERGRVDAYQDTFQDGKCYNYRSSSIKGF